MSRLTVEEKTGHTLGDLVRKLSQEYASSIVEGNVERLQVFERSHLMSHSSIMKAAARQEAKATEQEKSVLKGKIRSDMEVEQHIAELVEPIFDLAAQEDLERLHRRVVEFDQKNRSSPDANASVNNAATDASDHAFLKGCGK